MEGKNPVLYKIFDDVKQSCAEDTANTELGSLFVSFPMDSGMKNRLVKQKVKLSKYNGFV